jgi:hypothetical protein
MPYFCHHEHSATDVYNSRKMRIRKNKTFLKGEEKNVEDRKQT